MLRWESIKSSFLTDASDRPCYLNQVLATNDRAFRDALAHFPTGVVVVAGMHDGEPAGFTCQSFMSLSLSPALIAVAPSRTSSSWPKIASSGAFTVSVLSSDQEDLARSFAVSGTDKFRDLIWKPGATGAPRIGDALAWFDCRIHSIHDAGDHLMVFGEVEALELGDGGAPLVFNRSTFSRLAISAE